MGIGIREARNTLPTLVKRAAQNEEDIQLGSRGTDEVTLVSTDKYERMQRELARLRSRVKQLNAQIVSAAPGQASPADQPRPFAGLQRALEEGRLSLRADPAPRVRRLIPDYTGISPVPREEQIRLASHSPEPTYRRTKPRA
jgi:prevent-host-death family protein